jgi:hypothetical protein
LSDELRDSLEAYKLNGCISVLRNYIRDDFADDVASKIRVIPLGYRWSPVTPVNENKTKHWLCLRQCYLLL